MKLERKWRRRAMALLLLALLLLLAASLVPEITIGGYTAISVTNWRIRTALAAALAAGTGGWLLLRRHWCCPHCGAGVKLWVRRGGVCRCERCGRLLRFDEEPEEP